MSDHPIVGEIRSVWDAIANDILPPEDECPVFTGVEVQDIVADYVDTYISREMKPVWNSASWEQKHLWLSDAFPASESYGY